MDLYVFFPKFTGGGSRLSQKRGQIERPKPKFTVVFKGFSPKRGPAPSCRLCTLSGVVYNPVLDVSILYKILFRTGGGRNETLFNDIVSPMVYA